MRIHPCIEKQENFYTRLHGSQEETSIRNDCSRVRNVSTNGIGLFLIQTLEPGTLLDVELRSRSIVKGVARVVQSSKQEGGWLIGCTLDSPLSASELEVLRT